MNAAIKVIPKDSISAINPHCANLLAFLRLPSKALYAEMENSRTIINATMKRPIGVMIPTTGFGLLAEIETSISTPVIIVASVIRMSLRSSPSIFLTGSVIRPNC